MERDAIFEVFPDKRGKFRWHLKRGGRIVANSGEAYQRRRAATRSITNLTDAIAAGQFRVDNLDEAPIGAHLKR